MLVTLAEPGEQEVLWHGEVGERRDLAGSSSGLKLYPIGVTMIRRPHGPIGCRNRTVNGVGTPGSHSRTRIHGSALQVDSGQLIDVVAGQLGVEQHHRWSYRVAGGDPRHVGNELADELALVAMCSRTRG